MRITVWEFDKLLVSLDTAKFNSETTLLKALEVQRHPDQEFYVRFEDNNRCVNFLFDGSDGLDILAVLCYRGMNDIVFNLDIPAINNTGYAVGFTTPEHEVLAGVKQ